MGILPPNILLNFLEKWILTGSGDCTIKIWDIKSYQCLRILGKQTMRFQETQLSLQEISLNKVVIYNNYIIFHGDITIEVWKSSFGNLKHRR